MPTITLRPKNMPYYINSWQAKWEVEGRLPWLSAITPTSTEIVFPNVEAGRGDIYAGILLADPPFGIDLRYIATIDAVDGDIWEYDYLSNKVVPLEIPPIEELRPEPIAPLPLAPLAPVEQALFKFQVGGSVTQELFLAGEGADVVVELPVKNTGKTVGQTMIRLTMDTFRVETPLASIPPSESWMFVASFHVDENIDLGAHSLVIEILDVLGQRTDYLDKTVIIRRSVFETPPESVFVPEIPPIEELRPERRSPQVPGKKWLLVAGGGVLIGLVFLGVKQESQR